jgi:cobalt/nickel transport system permease protein
MISAFTHDNVPASPLSRWDARWKLASLAIAVVGIASLNHLISSTAALAVSLVAVAAASLPARWVRGQLILFGIAAVPFVVILPFTLDKGGPGWDLGLLHLSEHGLTVGLGVFCRCEAIACLTLLVLGTAPFQHTLAAAHKLRVPGVLVLLVGLAYRYLFLLADEYRGIRIALRTRGFHTRTNSHSYRTLGHATGAILVRGSDRAERVTAAMRCRGFDGTFRTTSTFRTTPFDFISCLLVIATTGVLVVCDRCLY